MLDSVRHGEKLTSRKLVALLLAFGGCIMVRDVLAGGVAGVTGDGNAFANGIVAGMSYALYTIFSKYAVECGYSGMTTTFYTFAFALIPCVLLADFGQIAGAVKTGGVMACVSSWQPLVCST
ncbi:hypothetical protein M7775_03880 [Sporomusa sphaeroides DSM 2875]|jgi:DME family drug/metabolite transporter|uniref:hypothetical protein n=1 Tax=Sporomusa sphaeroides TaxID=47679 RepID=UPI00202E4537|nr:hypothetical protein [Sporomusa sphaeroides]MCM0757709.1 hypothetical protein [Sporomusa sphaeroides DSM 2875]